MGAVELMFGDVFFLCRRIFGFFAILRYKSVNNTSLLTYQGFSLGLPH